MEPILPRQLFGGAVELSVPARMVDVSDFRTVPDNQEIFTDANEDQSVIVEFVEHHDIANAEAADFFFNDLATANDAEQAAITSTSELRSDALPGLPQGTFATLVIGQQTIGKGRNGSSALNKIQIQLLIVRLPEHSTDMLITLNTPVFIHHDSVAAVEVTPGYKHRHEDAPALFQQMLTTLKILDWGLFGGGGGTTTEP